jgi:hypothetical protein
MNETDQLKAMAAELVAAGYDVSRDVLGRELKLELTEQSPLYNIRLDLVGEFKVKSDETIERRHIVIIEVANRTRLADQDGNWTPSQKFVDEDTAISRFKLISEGLAEHPTVDFQIRFFDVSADQSAARHKKKVFKVKRHIMERVREDRWLLARSAGRDELSRALVIARLWAHWLRIVGNLHPGREHRELREADLRTIQKDLFDQSLLKISPYRYGILHGSLLSVSEGGDLDPRKLLELEPEVRELLDWATARYGGQDAEKTVETGSLFNRLILDIQAKSSGPRQEELISLIWMLRFSYGDNTFPREVASFLLAIQNEPKIADDLITELLERASQ